ncbi:FAD/NAD-P-binding domain-containing protein [Mycena albidolilacea]|uniref:FAD/NAD-P-binding domain-containing protein n=1 Tax=Mycena albidolilacea TaxID=1033008 RepID=A0AAD6ZPD7_9AGAR|nr:FAD/NAD-P-binding domain-containing protein [Mycena albidolilacea]
MGGFTAHAFLLATIIRSALTQQTVFDRWKDSDDIPEWTTFSRPINRVAVIGAGPSGLQAATHLLDANLTVRLFERAPSPGGNWFYTEETPVREDYPEVNSTTPDTPPKEFPATKYYEEGEDCITLDERWRAHWQPRPVWYNLRTNSPAPLTRLPGVQHNPDTPWLLSAHDLERNVRAYASLHGLNSNDEPSSPPYLPITSYATRVEAIQKSNETWTLTLRRLQWLPESRRLRSDWWTEEFDAVVVATGHFTTANIPQIKGIGNWSTAKENGQYSMIHSQSFRHPERYAGKTVLIVGASVSATHLSRIIAPFAHRLVASIRPNKYRDGYGLDILFSFAAKTEIVPEIASFEPLDGNDAGIRAGRITLVDGTILDGIDEVILATGYRTDTFLPDLVNPRTVDNLDWTGHYIHDPTLAYMFTGNPWTHAGYQGYAFAKVWTGKARLPSRERMWRDYENKKYQFGGPFDHLPQEGLRKQYVAWLNSESLELGGQFVEPLPLETRELVNYFINANHRKDYLSHENWTHFDNLPFSEWPKPPDREYKVVSW